MTDLSDDIRTYIDSAASPVTLDEIRGSRQALVSGGPSGHLVNGGSSMPPTPWRSTAAKVTAAAVVVAVLVGIGFLVARGPRTPPRNSALARPSPLTTAQQAIAGVLPSMDHVTRVAAKLTTYRQALAIADSGASFPSLSAKVLSGRVWVVALAGTVNSNATFAVLPEHYTWEVVIINQGTGKALGSTFGSTGGWPPFFDAIPDLTPPRARSANSPLVLNGDGIASAVFGQTESTAIAHLKTVLGAPIHAEPTPSNNCTIDSFIRWSTMVAYFDHQRFVGYSTGSLIGGPGYRTIPNVITAAGLRISDTLGQAKRLYGTALRTSLAQGGSWFASTSTGTLSGNLTNEVNERTPTPRVADINAGSVGCPAASP